MKNNGAAVVGFVLEVAGCDISPENVLRNGRRRKHFKEVQHTRKRELALGYISHLIQINIHV